MALNKSGLPPMKRPVVAAERPGGFGTVEPKKPTLGFGTLGKLPGIKLARGGRIPKMPTIPKMPKPPRV